MVNLDEINREVEFLFQLEAAVLYIETPDMAEVEAMEGILGKIGELFQKFFAKVASVFSWILDSLFGGNRSGSSSRVDSEIRASIAKRREEDARFHEAFSVEFKRQQEKVKEANRKLEEALEKMHRSKNKGDGFSSVMEEHKKRKEIIDAKRDADKSLEAFYDEVSKDIPEGGANKDSKIRKFIDEYRQKKAKDVN